MMNFIEFTPALACLFSHSNPWGWRIHPSDLKDKRAFITYWGFNSSPKAHRHIASLRASFPGIKAELRKAKRLAGFKYELKIWGLPWLYVRGFVAEMYRQGMAS